MGIGQNIKARRKELGISAETLAKRLGVNASTVYRYENGSIEKLDSARLEPIAEALLTTPAKLMGWKDDPVESPKQDQPRKWRMLSSGSLTLTDEQIDKLYNVARAMFPENFPSDE